MSDGVDDLDSVRPGDLVLSGYVEASDVSDLRSVEWNHVGIVAEAGDLVEGKETGMVYVDLTSGAARPLADAVDAIAGEQSTFVARIAEAPETSLREHIPELISIDTETVILNATRSAVYDHLDRIGRTCKFDGNDRPCPVHG